jgi:hypothetical protein
MNGDAMRNLSFATCLVLAGCSAVDTTDRTPEVVTTQRWLEPFPNTSSRSSWEEIPASRFFEVPASRLHEAELDLAEVPFLSEERLAEHYGGRNFTCESPAKVYLVRASYRKGTGLYSLHWADSSLIVEHATLGLPQPQFRSALVACLSKAPDAVYSLVGTDW